MVSIYFTYGSAEYYPYDRGQYVKAVGTDRHDAIRKYRAKHPDRIKGIVNCADYYTEEQFNEFRDRWYKGVGPAEVIR